MQKLESNRIEWNQTIKSKQSGYAVGRFGDGGTAKTFQVFSTHRTENGAVKKLRTIKGIGHLQIVEVGK